MKTGKEGVTLVEIVIQNALLAFQNGTFSTFEMVKILKVLFDILEQREYDASYTCKTATENQNERT